MWFQICCYFHPILGEMLQFDYIYIIYIFVKWVKKPPTNCECCRYVDIFQGVTPGEIHTIAALGCFYQQDMLASTSTKLDDI